MKDLVSVITPSYNSANFIQETIKSVLSQSYQNWEMLIVDDCSTDNSVRIIKEFKNCDNRIQLIRSKRNQGPALSRNEALKVAKGRYIAFIDSDDLWLPNKLEKQIDFMRTKNIVFSFSAYHKINEEGNIISDIVKVPATVTYNELLATCIIGILTAIYDAKALGKVYMPDLFSVEDYGLWLKILKRGHLAHGIDESLALYRVRKGGISRNKFRKVIYQWKVYRRLENISLFRSLYYMTNYAYYGYKKSKI